MSKFEVGQPVQVLIDVDEEGVKAGDRGRIQMSSAISPDNLVVMDNADYALWFDEEELVAV